LSTEKTSLKRQIDGLKSQEVVKMDTMKVNLNNLKDESKINKRNIN